MGVESGNKVNSWALRCPAGMADWRISATTHQRDFHSDTHTGQLGREDPAGIRFPSFCSETGLLNSSSDIPPVCACIPTCVCTGPCIPLVFGCSVGLVAIPPLGCVYMNGPVFSRISAGAMGSDGSLKLTAPVAIRGHVRNISRLVGCRTTPASWCSEPAPRSHARVSSCSPGKHGNSSRGRLSFDILRLKENVCEPSLLFSTLQLPRERYLVLETGSQLLFCSKAL